jgi:hypothetical protein
MNSHSHILFNKTPQQLRRLGARGGRAHARNQRARRALLAALPQPVPSRATETAAEAIAVLDTQFPWLRGAEKRVLQPVAAINGRERVPVFVPLIQTY